MNDTAIEWTEKSWNPVTGCSPVSVGCAHCYARRMAQRLRGRFGYPADEPFRVILHPEKLEEPLKLRKPSRIFVCSMGDLFHDDVDEKFIAKVFAIMDLARQHTYLVLTKRPARMQRLLSDEDFQFHVGWFQSMAVRELGLPEPKEIGPWPLRNVWVGVSVENQAAADERIPILLQTPAATRFISCEPLLGPVHLLNTGQMGRNVLWPDDKGERGIHWVICGAETGPYAKPTHPDWVRQLRDQCEGLTPFFFKGWGAWWPAYPQYGDTDSTDQFEDPESHPNRQYEAATEICLQNDGVAPQGVANGEVWCHHQPDPRCNPWWMLYVGRKAAGRLLDGREWNEFPGGARSRKEGSI